MPAIMPDGTLSPPGDLMVAEKTEKTLEESVPQSGQELFSLDVDIAPILSNLFLHVLQMYSYIGISLHKNIKSILFVH